MPIPFIDLAALHAPLRDELLAAVTEVIDSAQFIRGPWVTRFEQQVADYLGCRHAIGVSSGTDALLASLMALGVGPGDEVITTPYTFCATAEAILRVGAAPVFVDIDPRTFNLDPDLLERAITPATRAILPVHLYGHCARMDRIMAIAQRHQLWVIEDAAQAIGARLGGKMAGTLGHVGCFSFFPTKNLGALGDGGLVATDDDALADEIRLVCNHGNRPKYNQVRIGGNFRLDAIQAAALSVKLRHLDRFNAARRDRAARLDAAFARLDGLTPPSADPNAHHVYHQYALRVAQRDAFRTALDRNGIGWGTYYPSLLTDQPAYRAFQPSHDLPHARAATREIVCLPIANPDAIRPLERLAKRLSRRAPTELPA